jgi:FMN phosphatase YigB (HAD superfamily)
MISTQARIEPARLEAAGNGAAAVTAVTFDLWDTIVVSAHMQKHRVGALHQALADADASVRLEDVETAFAAALDEFRQSWADNEQHAASHAVGTIRRHLPFDVDDHVADELVEIIRAGDPNPKLTPNVDHALRQLRASGVRLGIICDVGWTPSTRLRSHLERHGVLELFDHFSFSDEVGHYKPSPAIFRHAHAGLGVEDPASTVHVGDLRRTDVAGARAAGVTSVRYTGVADDASEEPEADYVITDHAELAALLNLL